MDVMILESHSQDLLIYLYKLYQGASLCDIDIETSDGVVFSTHRILLASTSTFIHLILLANPSLTHLKLDIHSKVLQLLLEFGYTGQLFVSDRLQHIDVQSAATFLQMYSVLELLKKHSMIEDFAYKQSHRKVKKTGIHEMIEEDGNQEDGDSSHNVDAAFMNGLEEVFVSFEKTPDTTIGDSCHQEMLTASLLDQEAIKQSEKNISPAENIRRSKRLANHKGGRVKVQKKQKDKTSQLDSAYNKTCKHDDLSNSTTKFVNADERKTFLKCNTVKYHASELKTIKQRKDFKKNSSISNYVKLKAKAPQEIKNKNQPVNIFIDSVRDSRKTKKSVLKCCYCVEKLPFYDHHRHKCVNHKHTYLRLLFSSFLVRESTRCKMGTNYSYWQTGSKNLYCCNICCKKFTRYSLFSLHFNKEHVFKGRNGCWFKFLTLRSRNKRNNLIKEDNVGRKLVDIPMKKTSECVLCQKTFASKSSLAGHNRKFHGEGRQKQIKEKAAINPLRCFICDKCVHSEFALRKHLEIIHKQSLTEAKRNQFELPSTLKCEVSTCQFTTTNLQEMTQHVVLLHPYIQHQCNLCTTTFKVPMMLQRHIMEKHSDRNRRTYQCKTCQQTFPRSQTLNRHEYFKHGIKHATVKVYKCEHEGCGYVTSGTTSLKRHKSKHSKEKKYTCEYCGLKLKTDICYKKHVNKMHLGVRPYLCQVCGQSFGEDHELKSHINYKHSNDKEFKCKFCSYASSSKNTYFTHVYNVHKVRDEADKRTEYRCTFCPFKSIIHHRFKIHMNSHTNTRDYWCNFCHKTFVSSATLLSHKQWMHSENVFTCTQCEYQTKTRQKLNEHIRVQHQLKGCKPYGCPYCEFRCATGGNTRKHIKQVHRGSVVHYIRDDGLINAARLARATGHHSTLVFPQKLDEIPSNNSANVSRSDRQEFHSIVNGSSAMVQNPVHESVSPLILQNTVHTSVSQAMVHNPNHSTVFPVTLQNTFAKSVSPSILHNAGHATQSPVILQKPGHTSLSSAMDHNSLLTSVSSLIEHNSVHTSVSPVVIHNPV